MTIIFFLALNSQQFEVTAILLSLVTQLTIVTNIQVIALLDFV